LAAIQQRLTVVLGVAELSAFAVLLGAELNYR
jgi:hypothetical protein